MYQETDCKKEYFIKELSILCEDLEVLLDYKDKIKNYLHNNDIIVHDLGDYDINSFEIDTIIKKNKTKYFQRNIKSI